MKTLYENSHTYLSLIDSIKDKDHREVLEQDIKKRSNLLYAAYMKCAKKIGVLY